MNIKRQTTAILDHAPFPPSTTCGWVDIHPLLPPLQQQYLGVKVLLDVHAGGVYLIVEGESVTATHAALLQGQHLTPHMRVYVSVNMYAHVYMYVRRIRMRVHMR